MRVYTDTGQVRARLGRASDSQHGVYLCPRPGSLRSAVEYKRTPLRGAPDVNPRRSNCAQLADDVTRWLHVVSLADCYCKSDTATPNDTPD